MTVHRNMARGSEKRISNMPAQGWAKSEGEGEGAWGGVGVGA